MEEKREEQELTEYTAEPEDSREVARREETSPAGPVTIEDMERAIAFADKKRDIVLRLTRPGDWVKVGDNAYLEASGAQRIADALGVGWKIHDPPKKYIHEATGHFSWEYIGEFTHLPSGRSITETGSRSSNDGFFNIRYISGKKTELLPEQVDEAAVKKSAYTNCMNRGMSALMGLRGFTWAEVQKAGVRTGTQGYTHKTPDKPAEQSKPAPQQDTPKAPEKPAQTAETGGKQRDFKAEAEETLKKQGFEVKDDAPKPRPKPKPEEKPQPKNESPADKHSRLLTEFNDMLVERAGGEDGLDEEKYFDEMEKTTKFANVPGVRDINDKRLTPARLAVTVAKMKKGEV